MTDGTDADTMAADGGRQSIDSVDPIGELATDNVETTVRRFDATEGTTNGGFWTVVGVLGGWLVLLLVSLVGLDLWSIELYYTLSFVGLLAVRMVFAPTDRPPQWWHRLTWLVRVGFLVFGYVVVQQALSVL